MADVISDQFVLDGIVNKFRIFFHSHFFKYAGSVCANGFNAQREIISDFCEGFPGRDHGKDLVFAVGQKLVQGFVDI